MRSLIPIVFLNPRSPILVIFRRFIWVSHFFLFAPELIHFRTDFLHQYLLRGRSPARIQRPRYLLLQSLLVQSATSKRFGIALSSREGRCRVLVQLLRYFVTGGITQLSSVHQLRVSSLLLLHTLDDLLNAFRQLLLYRLRYQLRQVLLLLLFLIVIIILFHRLLPPIRSFLLALRCVTLFIIVFIDFF